MANTSNATSNTNPHIRDKHSPLSVLAMQALRRYGDFNPGTVDGDVLLMFIEFANTIIDEIRQHPYHDGTDINYYESAEEFRDIPDPVIVAGLIFQYALQQGSDKTQMYMPVYNRVLNQHLWNKLNGNTKIRMRVVDDGTNKRNKNNTKTSQYNGTTVAT
tara:strand:- start:2350 stop:2829 length:480 start_codon:yes stop_codon:yes gene_type:complete